MKYITLITGGMRSGKSNYAERLALSLSDNPVYLATSRVWDCEHKNRILRHRANRSAQWTNIEEDKTISRHNLNGRVVLMDCVTLWCTNFFFDLDADVDEALKAVKTEFDLFTSQDAQLIFVTNEIGMAGVPQNDLQRKFADLQGWANQYIAAKANRAILMLSGIPVQIK